MAAVEKYRADGAGPAGYAPGVGKFDADIFDGLDPLYPGGPFDPLGLVSWGCPPPFLHPACVEDQQLLLAADPAGESPSTRCRWAGLGAVQKSPCASRPWLSARPLGLSLAQSPDVSAALPAARCRPTTPRCLRS